MFLLPPESIHPFYSIILHLRLIKFNITLEKVPLFHINFKSICIISIVNIISSIFEIFSALMVYKFIPNKGFLKDDTLRILFGLEFPRIIKCLALIFSYIISIALSCLSASIIYIYYKKYVKFYLITYIMILSQCSFFASAGETAFIFTRFLFPDEHRDCIPIYIARFVLCYFTFRTNFLTLTYPRRKETIIFIVIFIYSIAFTHLKLMSSMMVIDYIITRKT
ncbi:hypothetical protein SLOPH_701 [Spraguea lophii 42_110]|uniref:Uncharacterized protein n=1 Tax=Spraguea lophii (strain 42_110) TaxID=1358809 RepID=S7XKS8_SPRLO|nr:hypothetical protein SLOPH_701 [Spraguea lophii 42_110]